MKRKGILIGIGVFVLIIFIAGVYTNYVDSGRVTTNHEPKFCIKLVNKDGSKVTYWGLGYKVIRYVGVSPNEPYENNIGAKMGGWFMKYELPEERIIEIEYNGKTIKITGNKDVNRLENILIYSKYKEDLCYGIITHTIKLNDEVYSLKEDCKALQKGNKQTTLSDEDLKTIIEIINNK